MPERILIGSCMTHPSRKWERPMSAEAGTDYDQAALGGMATDSLEIED